MDSNRFRLNIGPLCHKSQKKAEIELRETPDNIREGVEGLRRLLEADPTLHYRTDEAFLQIFLRPTKYYPQSAYKLMKRIAEYRKEHAQMLKDVLPSVERKAILTTSVINVLTERDQENRRILILNMGSVWNPSEMSTDTLFRVLYLIHTASSFEEETQVNGSIIIINIEGMGWKQVSKITVPFARKLLIFIQDAMPCRLKEIHVIFQTMLFKMAWEIFKPILKEKLKSRVHFHGSSVKSLHKFVDPKCLPADYGGELPPMDYTGGDWYPVLSDIEDRIKEWNSFGFRK